MEDTNIYEYSKEKLDAFSVIQEFNSNRSVLLPDLSGSQKLDMTPLVDPAANLLDETSHSYVLKQSLVEDLKTYT